MAAYNSAEDGNWSSTATWGGTGPPGAGDTVTITNNVTVTADTIIGSMTATTCVTCGGAAGGLLTITGCKLSVRGNFVIPDDSGLTISTSLILNPNGSTQGGIEFDGNSGVTPTMTTGQGSKIVCNGTSSGHCYIRTKSGSAANNAIITSGGAALAGNWLATYTDFTALGSSSTPGIYSGYVGYLASAIESFDHCTFNECGVIPELSGGYAGMTWNFTNCTWESTLATHCFELMLGAIGAGETRLIDSCLFLNRPYLFTTPGMVITNNYFADGLATGNEFLWGEFDGNFVTRSDDSVELVSSGSMTNNYFYTTQTATNWIFLITSVGSLTVSGNVAEYAGTGSVPLFGQTEEAANPCTQTFYENICFSSGSGSWSTILDAVSKASEQTTTIITHNTFIVKASGVSDSGSPIVIASSNAAPADTFTIKANILINSGSATGCYALNNALVSPYLVTDAAPAAAIRNNCWKGFAAVSGDPFSGVSGDTNIENGTVYYSPMSGATAPGANDLTNTDPTFFDTTRTLATWDTHVGGPGTAADALSRLQTAPSLVKSSLLPFVRAGYAPTNAVLEAASYPDDPSTTDAAGNAWPGAGPGIGAIGLAGSPISSGGATPLITASQCPDMEGWNTSALKSLSGFWGEICRDVSGDAVSPYNAAFQALLGFGHTMEWYIDQFGYPFNIVSDTTTLEAIGAGVDIYSPNATSTTPGTLAGIPFAATQYCEDWPLPFANVTLTNGSAIVTGVGFQTAYNPPTTTSWPAVDGGTYGVNGGSPTLTVLSIQSDTQLTLTANYTGSNTSTATLTGPFNMPLPSAVANNGNDHHQFVITISSSTGLPSKLYESYLLGSADGGSTWVKENNNTALGMWDLVTGTQNADPTNYTTAPGASGIPYWPLCANYDEVVTQGGPFHAMPITLGGGAGGSTPWGLGSGGCVFPAPVSNGSDGGAWLLGGVPLGGRLRLKASFNIASFMAANPSATVASENLLTAAKKYGFINVDWTSPSTAMQVSAMYDGRWNAADAAALGTIPTTDLELVDTVAPRFSISGPSTLPASTQGTWTVTQYALAKDQDSNYNSPVAVYWNTVNTPIGAGWTAISGASWTATEATPGPFTFAWTPPASGVYYLKIYYAGNVWLYPPAFTLGVGTMSALASVGGANKFISVGGSNYAVVA